MSAARTPTHLRGQIGQGIYSLGDLRTYLAYYAQDRETGDLALRWLSDALNPVDGHVAHRPDYAFDDLISLFVVRELRRLGVKPAAIREAEEYMRRTTGRERPFVHHEVMTDGRHVWMSGDVPDQVEAASGPRGQQAPRQLIAAYLKNVQYTDDIATTWAPTEHVLVSPLVQFGEPVIHGTRVPTASVAAIAGEAGVEIAASRLDIDPAAARAALRFERDLAAIHS
jgi:uncharacterized protein (DUF433 family)